MSTSMGIRLRRFSAMPVGFRMLWVGFALVVAGLGFPARQPPSVDLKVLDPALMKAVQASVSQRDVEAILYDRRASGPVHLQLYTSCDEAGRCTIFTTMDFPRSTSQPSALSLQIAMQVSSEGGNAHRTVMSTWTVRSIGPALDERIDYAGDFHDLTVLARNGKGGAMVSLLTSIQSAVARVLVANGVTTQPGRFESIAAVY